jgi:NitT/TauT family transport system substrate-binding protein
VGKVLRFSGDVWKNHACCITLLAERDIAERPEWAQRVNTALVRAQLWVRGNQVETARLLASTGDGRYTPHALRTLAKVLAETDYTSYESAGIVRNRGWYQRRIDFQPFPFPSYTELLVRELRQTRLEGDNRFLESLDPAFVARDLVDDRFVRKALAAVGGPQAFGLPADLLRQEVLT